MRPTFAEIDAEAIAHNVAVLVEQCAPAAVCAVVKADGYGHGSLTAARAALAGGATWLAVALVEEASRLRSGGIDAPILLLSECPDDELERARSLDLRITLYHADAVAAAAAAAGSGDPWPVHLKIDTGMNRVGAQPDEALEVACRIAANPSLVLEGVWTHCAVADDPADPFTDLQLDRFDDAVATLEQAGHRPAMRHAANSAVALLHPRGRYDLVRVGIAIYGYPPAPQHDSLRRLLRPALRLRSQVVHVHTVAAGEGVSYGRRWRATSPTRIATVPIGYADGVRRRLGLDGGEVLVRGVRRRILGVVTMDQLMIEAGDDVAIGDEVVLIGRQGTDEITADEVAARLDTISYEVLCDIGPRVHRVGRAPEERR